jgi:arabinogalactan oligomer/maltooligosaccharide transport system permease protein
MISLTPKIMGASLITVLRFLVLIVAALALVELVVYTLFHRRPKNLLFALVSLVVTIALAYVFVKILWPAKGLNAFKFMLIPGKAITIDMRIVIGVVLLLADLALYRQLTVPRTSVLGLAYLLLLPALIGIAALVLYPFAYNIYLAFTNMGMSTIKTYKFSMQNGLANFKQVFTGVVAHDASFWQVLGRSILWTAINVVCHVTGGMGLALLLNRNLRFKGIYRTLLIFPWAIPQTIACMSLRNEFNYQYGFVNTLVRSVGLTAIPWLQSGTWAFVAVIISNVWLGIPFMMVILLGGLQSISPEYYEAAEIDGATSWQQFWNITVPLLRPVTTPSIILGTVWTFNALNVIYLITQGGPQEKTDILVSSLYKAAFEFYRYGFAAAFALVIFAFLLLFSLVYIRASGGLKAAYE